MASEDINLKMSGQPISMDYKDLEPLDLIIRKPAMSPLRSRINFLLYQTMVAVQGKSQVEVSSALR